jgi:hypothetical protein
MPTSNETYAQRVARAVDDPHWQRFRKGLKGLDTQRKLELLRDYSDMWNDDPEASDQEIVAVNLRVENYLKALARGGQIEPIRVQRVPDDTIGRYQQALLENRIVVKK